MRFTLDDPEVEALARELLCETIERSGWYSDVRPQARAERIEHDGGLQIEPGQHAGGSGGGGDQSSQGDRCQKNAFYGLGS
jgi:hypothetical protein